jgi:ABC-type antimicrobial peptide transport system permease subunit
MLAMRARRRFIVFTLIYTVLVFWMAFSLENYMYGGGTVEFLVIAIVASVVLSVLYAWIIINYRRMEIATLKCIGWTNGNIRTIIVGEILWVSSIAILIVAEVLIHYAAGMNYYYYQNRASFFSVENYADASKPFLQIWSVLLTILIFIAAQVIGILLMYNKVLKLRPIVALRVMK